MKLWKKCGLGLALFAGLIGRANAQVPGVPAAAAPAAAAAPVAAAGANNIFSFFCMTPEQKAACKAKICNSPIGKLANNMLKPVGAVTGGLIGPCCPEFTAATLALPADSPAGAAARIKADEAAAKKRRADVRYLGTVDCNWWPEAQEALINGLRADKNECVRMEAALALGRGCCCNKKTMEALRICVEGSKEDGNPPERCERVKSAARWSLEHCLSCFVEVEKVTPGTGGEDKPKGTKKMPTGPITPAAYYENVRTEQTEQTVADNAVRALKKTEAMSASYQGTRSMVDILRGTAPTRGATFRDVYGPLVPVGTTVQTPEAVTIDPPQIRQEAAPVAPAQMPKMQPAPMPVGKPIARVEQVEEAVEAPAGFVRSVNSRGVRVYRKSTQPMQHPVSHHMTQPQTIQQPLSSYSAYQQAPAVDTTSSYSQIVEVRPQHVASSYAPLMPEATAPVQQPVAQQPVAEQPVAQQPVQPVAAPEPVAQEEQSAPVTVSVSAPAAEVPVVDVTLEKVLQTIRYSTAADQRVEAVYQLARMKDQGTADVIHGLVDAAEDLSPAVRHAAVVSLYHVNVKSEAVLDAVKKLQDDADPQVKARACAVMQSMFSGK